MPTEQPAPANPTLCVSLCETTPSATPGEIEELLASTCMEAGFPYCERIYVGSYFCENFFLRLADELHESMREICQRHEMQATLVVPVLGQAFLKRALSRLADVLARFSDVYDEVIVNDVGLFADLANWYEGASGLPAYDPCVPALDRPAAAPRIGLGRLFAKEMRDARYENLFESIGTPRLSEEGAMCLRMLAALDPRTTPLIEIDPTNATVDVTDLMRDVEALCGTRSADSAPSSDERTAPLENRSRDEGGALRNAIQQTPQTRAAELAIHLPFCYATTGRNCSVAAADEPDMDKFRLGRGCSQHCLRLRQGYLSAEGMRYLKHGRTYYFENPACHIAGTSAWRIVYAAAHETMRMPEATYMRAVADTSPTTGEVGTRAWPYV